MTSRTQDVVVVGGGIMGLNIAYQIKLRVPRWKVLVLEKHSGLGRGSSGYSSAILRHMYTFDEMMQFAKDGIDHYKQWSKYLGLKPQDPAPRARFWDTGYVWMLGKSHQDVMKDHLRMQHFGIRSRVLSAAELAKLVPELSLCRSVFDNRGEIEFSCESYGENEQDCTECRDASYLLEEDAGYFEPTSALDDLHEACVREGVVVRFKSPVSKVRTSVSGKPHVQGVDLESGESIDAPFVLNCAGPWCNKVNNAAGIQIPFNLIPTRVQVAFKSTPELTTHRNTLLPIVADVHSGIYFRPQQASGQLLISTLKEEEEQEEVDPDDFDDGIDSEYKQIFLNSLHHRVPSLPPRGLVTGVSGLYTVCKEDVHPVIGESSVGGYYVCNGFSGHGFKLAPAVGSSLAQTITDVSQDYDSGVPLAFFSPYRKPLMKPAIGVLA